MVDGGPGDGLTRWMVLQSCLHSIGTAAVMAGAGLMLSKRGLLSPAVSKGLAKISMNLTIPCLLFSTVVDCPQNHSSEPCPRMADNIVHGWALLILPVVNVGMGLILGYINTCIFRPPENFRRAAIAAVAFGNSTGMPITLLAVIYNTLASKTNFGTIDPIMYLSVYLLIYPVLTWGVGGSLMGVNNVPDPPSPPLQVYSPNPAILGYDSLSDNNGQQPLLENQPPADPEAALLRRKPSTFAATKRRLKAACDATFQPPVVASIIGMLIACTPLLPMFVDTKERSGGAALQFLTDGLSKVGSAAVPINMLILGASLAKGADWNTVPLRLNLSIAFAKLCVMPMVGLGTAILLKNYIFASSNLGPSMYLVVVLVTCTPTANNLMVMAELGNQDKKALATCIFTQYMVAPFLLTASTWLAISVAMDGGSTPGNDLLGGSALVDMESRYLFSASY